MLWLGNWLKADELQKYFALPAMRELRKSLNALTLEPMILIIYAAFAKENGIDLTVVGPELPLSMGIADVFKKNNLLIYGPSQAAAEIESSKASLKSLCINIKCLQLAFAVFDKESQACPCQKG
ncbi:MAG: hypothetical protein MZV64_26335 [Ignavibacteriales bacterium]|nr:hypothetical protein [Ignavibacteriales bacterium]